MNAEHERSRSLWMDVATSPHPPLNRDLQTDILVIGAGIMGLVSAYELAREGRKITVVDRGRFGYGMTARTTAHLTFELDDFYHELIKTRGKEAARFWYQSQAAAVDLFESICRDESIDCDFARVEGVLVAAEDGDIDYLKKELDAAHEVGFTDAYWAAPGTVIGQDRPGISFPRQARFHPLKFLNGVIAALERAGVALYEETEILSLEEKAGTTIARTATDGVVQARQVLVTTNSPFHLRIPIHTKQAPYRTYVIAAPVPKGRAADVLLWDTVEPGYHYVRLQPGESADMLIVGGEDHKSGTADDGDARVKRLEAWARQRWPSMGDLAYTWSGQVYEPADHVGFIGKSPQYDNVYLATGDSGQGMTTGGVAALILRDVMNGRQNPWSDLYDPSRKMTHSLREYLGENLEAARHWVEHVKPGDVASVEEIRVGEGALVKMDGKPVAAYRDDEGELHLRSAACTHAGCVVHWNGFERCWDCPCHGSQFSVDGAVLAGPAAEPLADVPHVKGPPRMGTDVTRTEQRGKQL